jgi:hypothetical protein
MAVPSPRRRSQRIKPFVAPCRYVLGDERIAGFLTELSREGGRLNTEAEPPAIGAPLVVELRVPRQALALRLPATVRWVRAVVQRGHEFGVSFDGASADDQKTLDTLVDEFLRRAASII